MHNEYKRQSPYRGFWLLMTFMILLPLLLFLLVNALMKEYSPFPDDLDFATAKALGCGIGFLFHMIFLLCGVLSEGWEALNYRIREFCENLVVGIGYAFSTYLEDMRDDGVTFVLYLAVILTNFAIMLDGFHDAIAIIF